MGTLASYSNLENLKKLGVSFFHTLQGPPSHGKDSVIDFFPAYPLILSLIFIELQHVLSQTLCNSGELQHKEHLDSDGEVMNQ